MLDVRIVTPQGKIFEDKEVESITLPTKAGVINVMDDHLPLISIITAGEINIEKENDNVDLSVSAGMLEIRRGSIIYILADTAEHAEEIDIERAEEAKKRAEEYLQEKENLADVDFANLQAKIQKEMARINLGRKYRKLNRVRN